MLQYRYDTQLLIEGEGLDEDEITDLIKREIKERDWFVYADSPSAKQSKWVKTELAEIKKYPEKIVHTIDLESDIDQQLQQIEKIVRQTKVYISYSHRDNEVFQRFRRGFLVKDIQLLSDLDCEKGDSHINLMNREIVDASHNGFVLLILSKLAIYSHNFIEEIQQANREQGKIIPIYLGNMILPEKLNSMLGGIQGIRLSENPTDEEVDEAIGRILYRTDF